MKGAAHVLVGVASALLLLACPAASAATGQAARAGRALEDQLACVNPPKPGQALRALVANGLVRRTSFDADGSPVFAVAGALFVYGKRVLFVTGWEAEGGTVREPFRRGPGAVPPLFLAVTLDAAPEEVPYTPRLIRRPDGSVVGSSSMMGKAMEYYTTRGTTITCYGG